jgi:putative SOS response-associated peptidase YedK
VPFDSFCEYADTKPRKTPTWFALDEDRPLAFFAGIWTSWHGTAGEGSTCPAEAACGRRAQDCRDGRERRWARCLTLLTENV